MSVDIEKIRDQIRLQPLWRADAQHCTDYYDGKQLTAEEAAELDEKGLGELIANVVKPAVNVLLGMEAKQRSDWALSADNDEGQDVAEALNQKLKEAERESRADAAVSEAYAHQVKAGLGWVEVGRSHDPFDYPYRVEAVHRGEIYWDWSARKPDLADAGWLVRERWYPADQLCRFFPDQAQVIKAAVSGWDSLWRDLAIENEGLQHAFDRENRTSFIDEEWRNREANMALLREVWYRTYEDVIVIRLPNGRVVELDKANEAHLMAIASGVSQPRKAVVSRLNVAFYIGPHELADIKTNRRRLPYVPFWGYREDRTRIPYGVVRDMLPMQDEVNARRRKLMWLLSSKRVQVDSDALDPRYNDLSDLANEVARPDAVIITNPARTNKAGAISIDTDLSLSAQQFEVMRDAEDAVQRVAGIYNAMMGRSDTAKSGLAINSLVEQGTNSVGDINDNYRYSRTLVGELLLDLLLEDMAQQNEIPVTIEKMGEKRQVVLNQPAVDPLTGVDYRENDVTRVTLKVALTDVPSTPAYRQQQMVQIGEVLKSLPPQVQAPLIPFYLEASDLPHRTEMANLVRQVLGLSNEQGAIPPEMQAQMEQLNLAVQQLQAQNQQLSAELDKAKRMEDVKMAEAQANAQLDAGRLQLERERFNFEKLARAADLKLKDRQQARAASAPPPAAPKQGAPA